MIMMYVDSMALVVSILFENVLYNNVMLNWKERRRNLKIVKSIGKVR